MFSKTNDEAVDPDHPDNSPGGFPDGFHVLSSTMRRTGTAVEGVFKRNLLAVSPKALAGCLYNRAPCLHIFRRDPDAHALLLAEAWCPAAWRMAVAR